MQESSHFENPLHPAMFDDDPHEQNGTEPHGIGQKHRFYLNVTEVGSERSSSTGRQYLQKHGMPPDSRQHPEFIERSSREDQLFLHQHGSYETIFGADGEVETVSTDSRDDRMSKMSDDALSHRSRDSMLGRGSYDRFEPKKGNDRILPAVLEFWEEGENAFLAAAITNLDASQVQFKLSPTYTLYMACRYRASTHFRPETTPNDRAFRLTVLMNNVANVMHQVIQDRYRDATALAFWLANTSELLHFLKQDRHLSAYTLDAQDLLVENVQLAFRSLVTCHQVELQEAMPSFLEDRDDSNEEEGTTTDVLAVLGSAMSILRRCHVNAALTIQIFSQLFHFIKTWLFNKVVCEALPNLCTRQWGIRLKRRLGCVEAWAEKQGLELAADCHLSHIVQAVHLLQASKSSSDDLASINSLCFKLNSLQLRTLLERYQLAEDEPNIPREFIESVVKVSENTADELARSEGREVKLEEDCELPFLLPEDGYLCDIVRGVPAGLQEFLQPLIQAGLCRLTIQPTSSGYWTIYMSDQDIGGILSGLNINEVANKIITSVIKTEIFGVAEEVMKKEKLKVEGAAHALKFMKLWPRPNPTAPPVVHPGPPPPPLFPGYDWRRSEDSACKIPYFTNSLLKPFQPEKSYDAEPAQNVQQKDYMWPGPLNDPAPFTRDDNDNCIQNYSPLEKQNINYESEFSYTVHPELKSDQYWSKINSDIERKVYQKNKYRKLNAAVEEYSSKIEQDNVEETTKEKIDVKNASASVLPTNTKLKHSLHFCSTEKKPEVSELNKLKHSFEKYFAEDIQLPTSQKSKASEFEDWTEKDLEDLRKETTYLLRKESIKESKRFKKNLRRQEFLKGRSSTVLKVKWNPDVAHIDKIFLENYWSKYGEVICVVSHKSPVALLEFEFPEIALKAFADEGKKDLFSVSWHCRADPQGCDPNLARLAEERSRLLKLELEAE